MPSATQELSDKMTEYFGDGVSEFGPINYLQSQGYKLTRQWTWEHDTIDEYDQMEQKAYDCLLFLVEEWDFGGLEIES